MNMPFVLEYKNDIWKKLGNRLSKFRPSGQQFKTWQYKKAIENIPTTSQVNFSVRNMSVMLLDFQCKINWWLLAETVTLAQLSGEKNDL